MRTVKSLAFLALILTLCILPKLTAEEKLELPGPNPPSKSVKPVAERSYPWETGDEAAVRSVLAERCGEIHFKDIACEQALVHFADLTGINMHVNWSALQTAAVEKDKEITLRVMAVRFDHLLELILADAGGGEVELAWEIRRNVLYISTKEELARSTMVVTYDVRDLMGYSTVHSLNGESIVVMGDMERLAYVIQTMIDPESWREAGGNVGAIDSYGEMIVVMQTRTAHQQIWELLNNMRQNWLQARH